VPLDQLKELSCARATRLRSSRRKRPRPASEIKTPTQRALTRGVLLRSLVAVVAVGVVLGVTPTSLASAPPGLTTYGRTVWNLDALLHDTFGSRPVYANAQRGFPKTPRNFSTAFHGDAGSAYYIYTFATARHSAFRTSGPTKPPTSEIGVAGYEVPLTIKGAYIYCGRGMWLFEHGGNGPANWQLSCHK
jgi:hypothetical protein